MSSRAFTPDQDFKLRKLYEQGRSSRQLAEEYDVHPCTVIEAIRRAEGKFPYYLRGKRQSIYFSSKNEISRLLKQYNQGKTLSQLAREWDCSYPTVRKAFLNAGGKRRSLSEERRRIRQRYYWDSRREQHIWTTFRLTFNDMLFLFRRQSGLCFWCQKILPLENLLTCTVDHIGGRSTWRQREKIRGICCPGNVCNSHAGMIEHNPKFYERVCYILKNPKYPLEKGNGVPLC